MAEKPRRARVYVAGKLRGKTRWEVAQNIRAAEAAGLLIAKLGGTVPIIPHSMYGSFDGELTDEFWIEATLELLRTCDVVVLLPGWEDSEGARGENKEAERLHLPVFAGPNALEHLRCWLLARTGLTQPRWQVWKRSIGGDQWVTFPDYVEVTHETAEALARHLRAQLTTLDVTVLPEGERPCPNYLPKP